MIMIITHHSQVSYGLCSALGFFYSAAHAVMPFLLLGVGIDDMFVIVQSLNTLSGELHVMINKEEVIILRLKTCREATYYH